MASRHLARSIAMQSLFEWDFDNKDSGRLKEIVARNKAEYGPGIDEEYVFIDRLVEGTTKNISKIDTIIEKAAPEWPIDQITVTVLQNTGDHARGGVVYQDDQGSGGGYWFAVKETDAWRIVLDGNGQISCSQMQKEGFPEAMIPDCCTTCKPTQ